MKIEDWFDAEIKAEITCIKERDGEIHGAIEVRRLAIAGVRKKLIKSLADAINFDWPVSHCTADLVLFDALYVLTLEVDLGT